MKLSVVIPCYNEHSTITEIVRRVRAVDIDKEIIIVDDGSTDGTRDILRSFEGDDLQVHLLEQNRGKAGALAEGFRHARGEVVVIQDADLEYDPDDYHQLMAPIEKGLADVVYGSRFLGGGPHRVLYYWHSLGNWFLTTLSNMFCDLNLSDMETCYKMFRAELLERITVRSTRFGIEPELTAKFARLGCRIYEVPVRYYGRTYAEGKKITWKDGFRAIYAIFYFRLFD